MSPKLRRASHLSSRDLGDDEIAILDPSRGQVLVLNALGAVIWHLCDGTRTVDDMIDFIRANAAAVNSSTLQQDVERFVTELRAAQCIEDAP